MARSEFVFLYMKKIPNMEKKKQRRALYVPKASGSTWAHAEPLSAVKLIKTEHSYELQHANKKV